MYHTDIEHMFTLYQEHGLPITFEADDWTTDKHAYMERQTNNEEAMIAVSGC
jgi:hypothetical protein